ncbi:MAG: glycosyltransferase family 2 protein [Cyclobacteriaceae bacterium]|nr:glycosyltransferase family 2 protein [Cyclobacteriaceae bacterium]
MTSTAIAILNYNGEEYLKKFLPTLITNSNGFPIYVGDNASEDNSLQTLKTEFPTVLCVELESNYGYSEGYNRLIKHIKEDYIVLVNSDVEVTNNWLSPLIENLKKENVAAVQPKIKSYKNKKYFEYAGAAGGYVDKFGYPFCRGRLFDTLEIDAGQYDNETEISWASGACFAIQKSVFEEVGGFDGDFFAHMEEIDLCWRLKSLGYKIQYIPDSTVYHVGGGTLNYSSPFKTYLNYRNGLYMLLKNIPGSQLNRTIVIRVLLDWLSAGFNLLSGKWKLIIPIFKAHWHVLKHRTEFLSKRTNVEREDNFRKPYSIVWKYFFRRVRQFSDL